jgi:hypothetical protein
MNSFFSNINPSNLPTNKTFGCFFGFVFTIIAIYLFYHNMLLFAFSFAFVAALFIFLAFFQSNLLLPFNVLWAKLGLLLGNIVSPIILGVIFFLLISPVAIFTRIFGRDILRLKSKSLPTYWIDRKDFNPEEASFRKQY